MVAIERVLYSLLHQLVMWARGACYLYCAPLLIDGVVVVLVVVVVAGPSQVSLVAI